MSAAEQLLSELRDLGAAVAVDDGRLHVRARPGLLSAELSARVRAAKPELVALLSAPIEALPEAPPELTLCELSARIFALPRDVQVEVWADAARLQRDGLDSLEAERQALATVTAPGWSGARPAFDQLVREQEEERRRGSQSAAGHRPTETPLSRRG